MPTVAVYVPAARWRELSERASDPAERVREHVRSWLDGGADEHGRVVAPSLVAAAPRASGLEREHVRPDPKVRT